MNPLGEDTSIMRTTAVPSMMEVVARNYNARLPEAALFENPTEYIPGESADDLPTEREKLILAVYGGRYDYLALKGMVEGLLATAGIKGARFVRNTAGTTYHPGRCAEITVNGQKLGMIGEVHPAICQNYQIGARAYIACLDEAVLFENVAPERGYKPLPRFPAATRDLALICVDELPVAALEKAIREAVGKVLEEVSLFDVYRGAQVAEGKKSVAYSLSLIHI